MEKFIELVITKTGKWILSSILVLFILNYFASCERIDAGHVGLKVNMTGQNQGVSEMEYVTGWTFYFDHFQKVYEFPVFQQHVEYEPFKLPSKGGTLFEVHPSFNYKIDSGQVANMFKNLRKPLTQLNVEFIKNTCLIACREVTNSFTPDSLLNNLAGYDLAVLTKLNEKLSPYFTASQFTTGLITDPQLNASILQKSTAVQNAQAKALELEVKKAEIAIDLAVSRKDSTKTVMEAQAEALSMTLKQKALAQSPNYIELIKWQNWNGVLPTVMSGGNGMMLQLKQ
jgi:hypothetical protein